MTADQKEDAVKKTSVSRMVGALVVTVGDVPVAVEI
jgi:hypothetical protein